MVSPTPSTIPIHVTSNSKALVWSVDDVRSLRVKHNICGSLTGTLPGITQQNVFLGLPLSLMPEEVVLLVENGKLDALYSLLHLGRNTSQRRVREGRE